MKRWRPSEVHYLLVSWSRQVPYLDKRSGDHRWDGYLPYVPTQSLSLSSSSLWSSIFLFRCICIFRCMYVKSRYEPAWFPRSSLSFCIFLYLLLNYMYLPTGRYSTCVFDDDDEHANTYLYTYLYLLRYMYLLAQLRELLGMYLYLPVPIPQDSGIDWNSPRPELHNNKTTRTQLPYLTLPS